MEIREAIVKDWEKVRDLYLTLLREDPQAFVDTYEEMSVKDGDYWINRLEKKDGKTFIAIDDNNFVGMGRINFYDKFPEIPVMHKLGVLSEYRGKGMAKELVKAREEWAKSRGAEKVRLYVIADNVTAVKFAEKNGYKLLEKFENDIKRDNGKYTDTLLMEKDLI
ncbi:MAG: GNAT family N-acetyltransferase [Candidatus Pacebacteria bacterium]|jgi:RimJ/RimL family protein N-acetyltransferase|nr:hypothetical protein [Parcubacteria group bacterium]MDP6119568.1 GNAT family N-acetyltransferase [Candidatus Paceibacterota bacterium]|tara:strand:+ start:473 stop:967 length:495 start_codon:yes stop_codon:yes gene_type:complete